VIKSGSHGQLLVDGYDPIRCTDWTLNIERDVKPQTPIYRWDQRSIPLKRSARGEASILYDPDDIGYAELFDSFRSNEPPAVELLLRTDAAADSGYDVQAHVSGVGTVVAVKDAHRVRLSFAVTGPVVPV